MRSPPPVGSPVLAVLALGATPAAAAPQVQDPPAAESLDHALRGAHFVENQGQWGDATIRFGLRSRGLDAAFCTSSFTMMLAPSREPSEAGAATAPGDCSELTVHFPGSMDVEPRGMQPQAARFHYFLGGDDRGIASHVPSYGAVTYEDLYDGVDLVVRGHDAGVLKYEFRVAPGADWSGIRVAYEGAGDLVVNEAGDLEIATPSGTLIEAAPRAWQEAASGRDGARTPVPARFELVGPDSVRFTVEGPLDPKRTLVIDPDVAWMLYLGGSDREWAEDLAVDAASGAVYVVGHTGSTDFEGRSNAFHGGSSDAFVLRMDGQGNVDWMTYFGGGTGLEFDLGRGVCLDGTGRVLVTGWTNSPDFGGANNAHHGLVDAFVARLDPNGVLDWMSYLGGTADDSGYSIAADDSGAALVAGQAYSTNFDGRINAHQGGNYDAFVLRVSPSGTLDWMRYLGGGGQDDPGAVVVDDAGAAWVAGDTWSQDFEGRTNAPRGGRDAFVARVLPSGSVDWMVYRGGSANDVGSGIALDGAGAALLGYSTSTDLEQANNQHHGGSVDTYLMRLDSQGAAQWTTYLGGSGWDSGLDVAFDGAGGALVGGRTESADYEGRGNSYSGGGGDAILARVSGSGSVDWMQYFGGSGSDATFGVDVDAAGVPWIAGYSSSTDFFGRRNDYHGGDYDAFVLRLADGLDLLAPVPGIAGVSNDFTCHGATPGRIVAFLWSEHPGAAAVPGCTATLALDQPALGGSGVAGPAGSVTVSHRVPGNAAGLTVLLQCVEPSTCRVSNLVAATF